jgi:CRP/FNR family transcriptional regulator, dissimilatory nitrate respiration regulator
MEILDKTTQVIGKTSIFNGLSPSDLEAVRRITIEKPFQKGEMIFFEGDEGNGFYIISEGQAKVYKSSSEGKEQILHVLGPGEPFGEVAVFAGRSFPANAMALSKSKLLFFPRQAFADLIAGNPSLALNMLAVLSMRLRQFTVQIENLTLKEVPERLAAYLIHLAKEQENEASVTLNISKGSLAGLLGTIPETLSRIFSKMTEQELIRVAGRSIHIINYDGLKTLAEYGKPVG